jgi:hypothetical protein
VDGAGFDDICKGVYTFHVISAMIWPMTAFVHRVQEANAPLRVVFDTMGGNCYEKD